MKNRHATVRAGKVKFQFRGKSGKDHSIELDEPKLAKIVKRCQDLPGQELFAYVDENGAVRDVGSADVNGYLRDIAGDEFTAKDFRTWAGTVLAAQALREIEELAPGSASKKNVTAAIEKVAGRLGNTKAVCRKCYVHPEIIGAYLDGALVETLKQRTRSMGRLPANEAAVLYLLEKRLEKAREPLSKKLQDSIRQLQAKRRVRPAAKLRAVPRPTKPGRAGDRRPAAS
jgi:DNA topoisomerase-1